MLGTEVLVFKVLGSETVKGKNIFFPFKSSPYGMEKTFFFTLGDSTECVQFLLRMCVNE